ncbi:hypothetical protein [Bradyrhizobium sp. WSM1417]|uniref:hypothetical protein n=1 Tax=Bradyrhizobium sp. WSM1417 TaxID=754500 RepID=UPI0012EC2D4C|nr:hypothetical protein [Bradyrhizobium sp. WSM1417]
MEMLKQRTGDPGNRAERRARRARVSRFGRGRRMLETALLGANEIGQHPHAELLRKAAAHWRTSGQSTTCFVCDGASPHPAAHLFAWSGGAPKQAAVAGMCCDCWGENDPVAIDVGASRLLRRIIPAGVFIDVREVQP